jgi:hypothetical protein
VQPSKKEREDLIKWLNQKEMAGDWLLRVNCLIDLLNMEFFKKIMI